MSESSIYKGPLIGTRIQKISSWKLWVHYNLKCNTSIIRSLFESDFNHDFNSFSALI